MTKILQLLLLSFLTIACNQESEFTPAGKDAVKAAEAPNPEIIVPTPTPAVNSSTPVIDLFQQTAGFSKKLDIVWVIDNSGSMEDEQNSLGTNFDVFISDFIAKDIDFQMAVTTTDCSSPSRKGRLVPGSDVNLTSAKAKSNPTLFMSDFRSHVKVGTMGSGNERGLEASEGFMQKYADSFIRKDAYLVVVIISDEEDQSPKVVDDYTNFLKSFKNQPGLVKVYTIVDTKNTNRPGNGVSIGSERYQKASVNTAGGIGNIRDDFYVLLQGMGESLINLLDSFALSADPVPGSLKVYVKGVLTTEYTYDAATRSIRFEAASVPAVGAEIKVEYLKNPTP